MKVITMSWTSRFIAILNDVSEGFSNVFSEPSFRIKYELKEIDDNPLVREVNRIPKTHKYILTFEVIHDDKSIVEADDYKQGIDYVSYDVMDCTVFYITFKDKPDLEIELEKFEYNMSIKEKFLIKGEISYDYKR